MYGSGLVHIIQVSVWKFVAKTQNIHILVDWDCVWWSVGMYVSYVRHQLCIEHLFYFSILVEESNSSQPSAAQSPTSDFESSSSQDQAARLVDSSNISGKKKSGDGNGQDKRLLFSISWFVWWAMPLTVGFLTLPVFIEANCALYNVVMSLTSYCWYQLRSSFQLGTQA